MKIWLRFLLSKSFLRTLLGIVVAWAAVLLSAWLGLHLYSQHGEQVAMPDVRGMSFNEAKRACADIGLEVVHLDSVYADNGRAFHVLDQIPPPAAGIKAGRNIYLTTYRSMPPAEIVSVHEGQDISIARIVLANKGFKVTERFEPNVSLVNRVVRLENDRGEALSPTDRLRRGSHVVLFCGQTTGRLVAVPDCQGLSLDSARAVLRCAQLGLGLVEYSLAIEDAADSSEALVIEQHPLPNESAAVQAGTELDLYLGEEGEAPRSALEIEE